MDAHEAAAALQNAAATERRSAQAYSYSQSAPFCLIWGLVWFLGYGAEALVPRTSPTWMWLGWWWMGLTIAGAAASIVIGRIQSRRSGRSGWRFGMLFLIIWLFIFCTFSILHPQDERQVGAFFPLLFAAIYAALGLWMGLRYILVGAFTAATTMFAYFWMPHVFLLWMAIVGGGSLFLTGLWLRRA